MPNTVIKFLAAEAVLFGFASLLHAGRLAAGYAHRQARIAETVIAVVLVAGLIGTLLKPSASRVIGLVAQGFALLLTFVGLTMIAIGVGPRSALDLVLHLSMITLLITGIVTVRRRVPRAMAH